MLRLLVRMRLFATGENSHVSQNRRDMGHPPETASVLLDSKVWRCSLQGIYILSGVRTPIGKFGGSLASLTAADMGVVAAQAAMERGGVEAAQIDETIFGCARQAGGGPNVARQ